MTYHFTFYDRMTVHRNRVLVNTAFHPTPGSKRSSQLH